MPGYEPIEYQPRDEDSEVRCMESWIHNPSTVIQAVEQDLADGKTVMFVTMKPTRGRRDGHGHRRTVRLHHARRPSPARIGAGQEPIKVISVDVGWTRTL